MKQIKISGRKLIGQGSECRVYAYGNRVVKMYSNKQECYDAYYRQSLAYNEGFGPPVYGTIRTNNNHYGYISARVKLLKRTGSLPLKEYYRLSKRLKQYDMTTVDVCNLNCGIYRGKYVVIDFGNLSVGR